MRTLVLLVLVPMGACGGSKVKAETATASEAAQADGDAMASAAVSDEAGALAVTPPPQSPDAGATTSPDVPKAPERPFANNAAEATTMIDAAVDAKGAGIRACVEAARTRRKAAHVKVVVEIGIDQEGKLIGVKTVKGQPADRVLNDCVRDALTGAPFPRSHAGVITVKKSFEDQAVFK